jgi:predicted nucleic acid-binding Zn ribbon protein
MQSTVDRLVAERGWGTDLAVAGAVARWPQVVGERVAQHASAEAFDDGVLTVRADSTSWASEVRTLAPNILAALARELGDNRVTRLDVKGPDAPSWRHGGRTVRGRGPRDTYG